MSDGSLLKRKLELAMDAERRWVYLLLHSVQPTRFMWLICLFCHHNQEKFQLVLIELKWVHYFNLQCYPGLDISLCHFSRSNFMLVFPEMFNLQMDVLCEMMTELTEVFLEEWIIEKCSWYSRLQAEQTKHLPPGLVLMKDEERLDVLKTLEDSILF